MKAESEILQELESTAINLTLNRPAVVKLCDALGVLVINGGLPSLKSQIYCLPMAMVSAKSTCMGTHPVVSLNTPSMLVLIVAATPARLNAIFTAARLQLADPLLGAHTPGVVGNLGFTFPQLARRWWHQQVR